MLKDRIGDVSLVALHALTLRDFIDQRVKEGAGGVTIAADLSFLSAMLKWDDTLEAWTSTTGSRGTPGRASSMAA